MILKIIGKCAMKIIKQMFINSPITKTATITVTKQTTIT